MKTNCKNFDFRQHVIIMKRRFTGLLLSFAAFLMLTDASGAVPAPSTKTSSTTNAPSLGKDFTAFKIIYERNIFNPNRRSNSSGPPREETRPVKVETITLTGTMQADGDLYAFFDGSESRYKTALKQKQTIANLTLVEIKHDRVKFTGASNSWEVPMLMQLRREDNGEWKLRESPNFVSNNSTSPEFGSSSGGGAEDPDVLKRLLKKRESEDGGNGSSSSTEVSESPKTETTQQTQPETSNNNASTASINSSNTSSSSVGTVDDTLKRLLQRREQE